MINKTLLTTSLLTGLAGMAQAEPPDAGWRDHWQRHNSSHQDAAATPSTNNTVVKAGDTGSIVDASGDTWTIANDIVEKNGAPAGYSAHVTQIVYVDGTVWQQNAAGLWWRWDGNFWPGYGTSASPLPAPAVPVTAPTSPVVTATSPSTAAAAPQSEPTAAPAIVPTSSAPSPAATTRPADATPTTATPTASLPAPCGSDTTTEFGVLPVQQGGAAQIVDAKGNRFVPRGINIMGFSMGVPSAATLKAMFPGINFLRLAIYNYDSPQALQPVISDMTGNGIVVELENHTSSDGQDRGGGTGSVFSGEQLTSEQNWYSSVASAFKSNPYVWFGTNNEPPGPGQDLSNWQSQTYQTIRNAGNNSPILLEAGIGATPMNGPLSSQLTASVYASMNNVIWDLHYYGWVSNYSTDQAAVSSALTTAIQQAQSIKSAGGATMPVHIGEYGNSTTGGAIDPNGTQVINAVHSAVLDGTAAGSSAWAWGSGGPGDGLTNGGGLSSYGQQVASYLTQAPPGFSVCSSAAASSTAPATTQTVVAQTTGGNGAQSSGAAILPTSQSDAVATAAASGDQAASSADAAIAAMMQQMKALQTQMSQMNATTNPGLRAVGQ